jgi:hypothetical protein
MRCRRPLSLSRLPRPLAGLASVAFAVACSSSSAPTVTPIKDAAADAPRDAGKNKPDASAVPEASMGGSDARPDVILDPNDCVSTTAASSENGVGGYCSPGGGQCVHAGVGGSASLCSADFGAPAHEWFCTLPCDTTSECGAGGGTCISAPFADICVPSACAGALGDASSQVFDAGEAGADGGLIDGAVTDATVAHDAASDGDAQAGDATGG